jgi:hypothetical protein
LERTTVSKKPPVTPWNVIIALVFFALCFCLLAPSLFDFIHLSDPGTQLAKGQQILFGKHPYVHVYSSVYGPAVFYSTAFLEWLQPGYLLLDFLTIFSGYLISYGLLFLIVRDCGFNKTVFYAFVLVSLSCFPNFHKFYILLGPSLFLFALYRFFGSNGGYKHIVFLSGATLITGLFRLDFGLYCTVAAILAILLKERHTGFSQSVRSTTLYLFFGLVVLLPWLLFVFSMRDPMEVVKESLQTTFHVKQGLALDLPPYDFSDNVFSKSNLLFLLYWSLKSVPFVIIALHLIVFLELWKKREIFGKLDSVNGFILCGAVFAALIFFQAGHRIDIFHIRQSAIPTVLIFFVAVFHRLSQLEAKKWLLRAGCLFVILFWFSIFCSYSIIFSKGTFARHTLPDKLLSWRIPVAEVIQDPLKTTGRGATDFLKALRTVQKLTDKSDAVLFLPYMPQAYYLVQRKYDLPFGWLNPGRFLAPGSQVRYIRKMGSTRLIVDRPGFTFRAQRKGNARDYAPQLMDYIYSRYGIFRIIGRYALLSSDPEVWKEAGVFTGRLEMAKLPTSQLVKQKKIDHAFVTVNTIPVFPDTQNILRMPKGAGLLLETKSGTSHQKPGLFNGKSLYIAAGNGKNSSAGTANDNPLIDTASVPTGAYELVLVDHRGTELIIQKQGIELLLQ